MHEEKVKRIHVLKMYNTSAKNLRHSTICWLGSIGGLKRNRVNVCPSQIRKNRTRREHGNWIFGCANRQSDWHFERFHANANLHACLWMCACVCLCVIKVRRRRNVIETKTSGGFSANTKKNPRNVHYVNSTNQQKCQLFVCNRKIESKCACW